MQGSKLLKIFKTMSKDEFKQLRRFTQSEFFNTDSNLVQFLDVLSKYHPLLESRILNREVLYEKLFPGRAYNDAKWRNLVSKMNKVTEAFLIWQELEKAETIRNTLLIKAYGHKNLYKRFEKNTVEHTEKLDFLSKKTVSALVEKMQANLHFYNHLQTSKVEHIDKLQSAMDDLDSYYFAEKLRLACELKVTENIVKGTSNLRLITEVSSLVQLEEFKDLKYLILYDKVYKLLTQKPSMEEFLQALSVFMEIENELSFLDKQFGLLHLLNFAINQTNKGEKAFIPQLMRLYKLGLSQGSLLNDGHISESTFINIVTTASGLKEFDWVRQFIIEYEKLLQKEGREETKNLSLGYLYFHEKKFGTVIDLLFNSSFQNPNKLLSSKSLLLRSYFEMFLKDATYFNIFSSFAKAFDKFIKREKQLSLTKKIWYKNLISILLTLAKHKYENTWNNTIKAKVIDEATMQHMYLKTWILERVKEL